MKEESFEVQVQKGDRFEFGKNWKAFLGTVNDLKIENAKQSLVKMLGYDDLNGKTFLDAGCGSGLFSLAATQLGANVYSFDFDPNSVRCTEILKERYYPQSTWKIQAGSILDENYVKSLGQFDIVYSWGVLHHTGNLNQALNNINIPVKEKGKLFIAIYNDEGPKSVRWRKVKKIYNSNFMGKAFITSIYIPLFVFRFLFADIRRFRNPFIRYKDYKNERGMSLYYDWFDWLGGLPFEVASPQDIFERYKKMNYSLIKLKTVNGLGCNEFVFRKDQVN